MNRYHYVAILLAVSCFIFFFGLGEMALTDPDETFYAETAKEMQNSGEWITPVIFGEAQFEKPVFYYWLIRISYKIFGVSEFSARVPSAVFALIGIFGIYLLGRLLFSPLCGFLSALVMATSLQYFILARACVTDMVLTVFILFSLVFFIIGWVYHKKLYYWLASIMTGLAVLTKGPIGLLIPVAIISVYIFSGKRWKEFKKVPLFSSILIFLAVSLPWYLIAYKVNGATFINEFFGFQNVTRFLVPEHRIGSSPVFYFPVILAGIFPWSMFLPLAAWDFFRTDRHISPLKGYKVFIAAWFLFIFLFFSISKTKLVTYIFPLFPVLGIVVGRFLERFISSNEERVDKQVRISYYLTLFSTFAASIGILLLVEYKYPLLIMPVILCIGLFVSGIILSYYFIRKGEKLKMVFSIVASLVLIGIPVVKMVLPVIEVYESSKVLSNEFNKLAKPGEPIGAECDHRRGVAYYSGRINVKDIHPYHELTQFVLQDKRVWGIIQLKHYKQAKEELTEAYIEPVSVSGKYVLITNKPFKASGREQR